MASSRSTWRTWSEAELRDRLFRPSKKNPVQVAGRLLPEWTLEELRILTLLDAIRLDALVSALERKGVLTRQDYLIDIENSIRNRMDKILESLTVVPEPERQRPISLYLEDPEGKDPTFIGYGILRPDGKYELIADDPESISSRLLVSEVNPGQGAPKRSRLFAVEQEQGDSEKPAPTNETQPPKNSDQNDSPL